MRSHGMTYVLFAVVLGIWGMVAWKIFFSHPDGPAVPEPVAVPATRTAPAHADTLRLNYRDPFLNEIASQPAVARDAVVAVAPVQAAPVVEPPVFTYTGMIRKGRTLYYLFTVDGTQAMIRPGEPIGEYRLADGCADSVVLIRDNHRFCLKPQS